MGHKMWSESEYIIWYCETQDDLKELHPEWTKEQVLVHMYRLAKKLYDMKLIPTNFLERAKAKLSGPSIFDIR